MSNSVAPEAKTLLHWYARHRRTMPWRALPGESIDPYKIWLSEVMLQQTTVRAVVPYFQTFLERFPNVAALAAAQADEVMEAWAGLGYYARARNLHACAKAVAEAGSFPRTLAGLRALPGVGEYTAAAIASIAFGIAIVPVDGNVERVAARVFGIDTPLPLGKRQIAAAAARLGADPAAQEAPADFTQALFDLGATICTPRRPACALCPWQRNCLGFALGAPERLPVKAPRRIRPVRHGVQFWLEDGHDHVLLRRRAPSGLLGGMLELPGTEWRDQPWPQAEALENAPQQASWHLQGQAAHGFTHFEVQLDVYAARVPLIVADGLIHEIADLGSSALPRVMRRCVELCRAGSSRVKAPGA